jgi:uncharacterized protein (TIGR02301 family)
MMRFRLAAPPLRPHNRGVNRFRRVFLTAGLLLALAGGAAAQEEPAEPATELPPPIYEDKLLRLAEILGSLSFLRDLCGEDDGPGWRAEMSALLAAEEPGPQRRQRLVASFNHGFETFNAVYRACTPSAERAIFRYLSEGQALASDVRSRYSQ